MNRRLALVYFFVATVRAVQPVQLPPNFKTCKRHSSDLNGCLKDAVQRGIEELVKGSRPLGVLPIDPLRITELIIDQGNGPVSVKLEFKDLLIRGIGSAKISSVALQEEGKNTKLLLNAKLASPISLLAKYKISGKILVLPISGFGDCNITLSEPETTVEFIGEEVTRDDAKYIAFKDLQFHLKPKHVSMHFENLFNGDRALGDNMNVFLNENWKEVYGELEAPIEKAFGMTILQVTNRIFAKVSSNVIFPS